ncbi:MAG: hypothetical protein IPL12_21525 [Bacteroidetes bacterium]|nr:hypothetical protein [Bacteroidota bacterium]
MLWIRDKEYKTTSLRDLGNIFDSRVVVIHVVIVLGTFASMFAGEKLFPDVKKNRQYSLHVFICIVKDWC